MGVQLNIKDPETVRMAREMAERTGLSVTETIRVALERDQAARAADIEARVAEIEAIVADIQRSMTPEERAITSREAMDSIYDEGLPA